MKASATRKTNFLFVYGSSSSLSVVLAGGGSGGVASCVDADLVAGAFPTVKYLRILSSRFCPMPLMASRWRRSCTRHRISAFVESCRRWMGRFPAQAAVRPNWRCSDSPDAPAAFYWLPSSAPRRASGSKQVQQATAPCDECASYAMIMPK
jgi:hypothetical protein